MTPEITKVILILILLRLSYIIIMMKKKRKTNFIFISVRKNLLTILFVLFLIGLVLFSKDNLEAAKSGLTLWVVSVVPALLPFFIACELLSYTNIIDYLGKRLGTLMRPVFHVPGEGAFPLLMGIISGYPVGAKIVTNFRKNGICTKEEAERLLTFTNNSGPLFIIGTVGISLFGNTTIGLILFVTHFLSSLTVGFLFRFWKSQRQSSSSSFVSSVPNSYQKLPPTFHNLGTILQNSIMNSIHTIVMIGGFVMLFSVIISILKHTRILDLFSLSISPLLETLHLPSSFANGLLTGIIELTNGVSAIANIPFKAISVNMIICAFLLGFGGISILLQVFSIISTSDISIKPYLIGKLLQGLFAAFYTYLLVTHFTFLNFDL